MVRRAFAGCVAALCLIGTAVGQEAAEERIVDPLWEIGLFGGGVRTPAYRGSDDMMTYGLPLPYIVYRGDTLQVNRDTLKGLFFTSKTLELDLSVFAEVNDDDDDRRGMEELDPVMLELGPALRYYLKRSPETYEKLFLELPVRAAVSADLGEPSTDYRGVQARINIFYEDLNAFGSPGCELVLGGGLSFMDENLTAYYYDVGPEYVTEEREFFEAGDGYAGASLSFNFLYRLNGSLSIRTYARYDSLHGTVFEDSPLMDRSYSYTVAAALFWRIWAADEMVPRM